MAWWLEHKVPPGIDTKPANADEAAQQYLLKRELGRRLGRRGWLYPSAPNEFGGGGLDVGSVIILQEEMRRFG